MPSYPQGHPSYGRSRPDAPRPAYGATLPATFADAAPDTPDKTHAITLSRTRLERLIADWLDDGWELAQMFHSTEPLPDDIDGVLQRGLDAPHHEITVGETAPNGFAVAFAFWPLAGTDGDRWVLWLDPRANLRLDFPPPKGDSAP